MKLTEEQKNIMDDNFWDNPEPDSQMLNALKTPEELDYLVEIANWDVCVPILQWVAERPFCSKATALKMFWMAQPEDFTIYDFDKTLEYEQEMFHLIKIIYRNYQKNFYVDSDIHYNPQDNIPEKDEISDFMKQSTNGEEWYMYYDKFEVDSWFGEELEHKYKRADSSMELFNFAYFCRTPENAKLILNHKLCDKGIAVLLFWRLKTYAICYTATDLLLDEIERKVEENQYQEIIAYDPKTDDNIKFFNKPKKKWVIAEVMKQPV